MVEVRPRWADWLGTGAYLARGRGAVRHVLESRRVPARAGNRSGSLHPSRVALGWPWRLRTSARGSFFVFLDALIVIAAYSMAEVVYFRDRAPSYYWQHLALFLATALVVQLSANRLLGLYGRMWRHAGVEEARQILLSVLCCMAVLIALHPTGKLLRIEVVPFNVVVIGGVFVNDGNGSPQVPLPPVRLAAGFEAHGAARRRDRDP